MNRNTIALATSSEFSGLTPDERLLAACLRDLGTEAFPLVWDQDPVADANQLDAAIVIRSCWDYHRKPQEFLDWIARMESSGRRVWNPPSILRWNLDKFYLRELAAAGVQIPSTVWLNKGDDRAQLAAILRENQWNRAILKPAISATAWRTSVITSENAVEMQAEFEDLLLHGRVLVQQFVEEVQTKGEWSFIFFDKEFSHAVLKRAQTGEFRVQTNFGGNAELILSPPADLIEDCRRILESIDCNLLYARVDGVETEGSLCLMELELIEPQLFLINGVLAKRFARTIHDWTSRL